MVSLLPGCSAWRWSGHPAGMTSASPTRAGSGGHDARSHGVPLHGAPGKLPSAISEGAAKDAAPFLAKVPRTTGEHGEAARAYLDKADQYRREAASHSAMKRLYGDKEPDMAAHCDRLIEQLSALAAQYEDMSILHERKADELKQPGR
ncbi:MAG: hypothetical protein M0D55_07100 [Elusimicrobiota bacterium]|nr:MAG: hypothetical protein M0D55_07100 [Elusimicrobiota bacterium]